MPETTTDLKLLRQGALPFTWGRVRAIHDVSGSQYGGYSFVEYLDNQRRKCFHAYVDGKETWQSFYSLEEAIVFAIAYAKEGANTRAHVYFIRGLGLDATEDQ